MTDTSRQEAALLALSPLDGRYAGKVDALRFIVAREIYKHLERIVDAFEDVANEIDGIVIDHA